MVIFGKNSPFLPMFCSPLYKAHFGAYRGMFSGCGIGIRKRGKTLTMDPMQSNGNGGILGKRHFSVVRMGKRLSILACTPFFQWLQCVFFLGGYRSKQPPLRRNNKGMRKQREKSPQNGGYTGKGQQRRSKRNAPIKGRYFLQLFVRLKTMESGKYRKIAPSIMIIVMLSPLPILN